MKRLALLAVLASSATQAETIDELHVDRLGSRYQIVLHAHLDAAPVASYTVFRDFHLLPQINSDVERARRLPQVLPDTERWQTRTRVCIGWFCRHLDQVQDVSGGKAGETYTLRAQIVPEHSNLRYGDARWDFIRCGTQTCLHFQAAVEPAFWVPPLLGPWLIERAMRQEAQTTAHGIETLVRSQGQISLQPPPP